MVSTLGDVGVRIAQPPAEAGVVLLEWRRGLILPCRQPYTLDRAEGEAAACVASATASDAGGVEVVAAAPSGLRLMCR